MDNASSPTPADGMIDGFRVIRAMGNKSPPSTLLVRRSDGSDAAVLKFIPRRSTERDALQAVDHPGICQLLKSGIFEGHDYVLLTYYGQQNLMERVKDGITISSLMQFLLADCRCIGCAAPAVDGAWRPAPRTCFDYTPDSQPVLIDLGSAYRLDDMDLLSSGGQTGSAAYLSPEGISCLIVITR